MVLLIIIYMAFISLGVPDSLIGVAWPQIYEEFNISVSLVSILTAIVSGCTVLSSLFSASLINRFGAGKIAAFSTAMTAVGILAFSFSGAFWMMCVVSVFLGLGAGAIDSALNNYVALHYRASQMNFLHCFYGIGVSVSPFILSLTLPAGGWRSGYRIMFFVQLAISIILLLSLPLWKKQASVEGEENGEDIPVRNLSLVEMIKQPKMVMMWIVILATNMIETALGAWGSTYLVTGQAFSVEVAARAVMIYYIGLTLGRLLGSVLSIKHSEWKIVGGGVFIIIPGLLCLLFADSFLWAVIGFFLIGLGNGPIYPNLLHLTPKNFGEDVSQSVMGAQIAVAYTGVIVAPLMLSLITKWIGMWIYPTFICILFVLMVVFLVCFCKKNNNEQKMKIGK